MLCHKCCKGKINKVNEKRFYLLNRLFKNILKGFYDRSQKSSTLSGSSSYILVDICEIEQQRNEHFTSQKTSSLDRCFTKQAVQSRNISLCKQFRWRNGSCHKKYGISSNKQFIPQAVNKVNKLSYRKLLTVRTNHT